ncbi:MAG TPA: hypothetical protein VGW34_05515 [Allosphingosinicella sp.]|nr:hypothetical protein [Allosphingosinicella sp.]
MTSMIVLLLAGASVFPEIDRAALDRQARAEAQRPVVRKAAAAKPQPKRPAKVAAPVYSITAVCRAAGEARDAADFLAAFAHGYKLGTGEAAALRETCSLYFIGKREGRAATLASLR